MFRLFTLLLSRFYWVLDKFAPIGDLCARIWVAKIFFMSGLLKIQSWDQTLTLFELEYKVPFLTPQIAAVMGTCAELILPILLALGLGGRLTIFIFFMLNIIAVISYPSLWEPQGAAGLDQHISWGLLLALLMFHGSGRLSLDHLIRRKQEGKF